MPSTIELTEALQEQVLDGISQSEKAVVEAVGVWAETFEKAIPSLPAGVTVLPLASELPTPAEIVANAFDFSEKLLATQREFVLQLIAASAPAFKASQGAKASKAK